MKENQHTFVMQPTFITYFSPFMYLLYENVFEIMHNSPNAMHFPSAVNKLQENAFKAKNNNANIINGKPDFSSLF